MQCYCLFSWKEFSHVQYDHIYKSLWIKSLPGGSDGNESTCNAEEVGKEDTLEKEMTTHSSILAWRFPWTEEPMVYSPWGHKESETTEQKLS